jgi:hypothetical protein
VKHPVTKTIIAFLALVAATGNLAQAQETASSTPAVLQPAVSPVAWPANAPHPAPGVLELRASLSARTLYLMRGDSLLAEYPVAVGADEHPTPRGDFLIRKIVWNPRWVPPDADWARGKSPKEPGSPSNPMKVVKIFFQEPDYYIHGTGAVESLGKAESHGCLRMDPDQAVAVAKLIMEHGGQPHEENWFLRVLHFRREEKPVYLDNPIRLVIAD